MLSFYYPPEELSYTHFASSNIKSDKLQRAPGFINAHPSRAAGTPRLRRVHGGPHSRASAPRSGRASAARLCARVTDPRGNAHLLPPLPVPAGLRPPARPGLRPGLRPSRRLSPSSPHRRLPRGAHAHRTGGRPRGRSEHAQCPPAPERTGRVTSLGAKPPMGRREQVAHVRPLPGEPMGGLEARGTGQPGAASRAAAAGGRARVCLFTHSCAAAHTERRKGLERALQPAERKKGGGPRHSANQQQRVSEPTPIRSAAFQNRGDEPMGKPALLALRPIEAGRL